MSGRLEGKIALITGAASGIGRDTAALFVAEGAKVLATDIDEEAGRDLETAHGGALRFLLCDVTEERQVAAAVAAACSEFGGLDILFNNAGSPGPEVRIADMTTHLWDMTMALAVRGPMLGIKHAVPAMRARGGGAIVNTASIAALEYGWGAIAYSTAKAAVLHMTRCAAAELAQDNIRVNAVCPGVIATGVYARYLGVSGEAADRVFDMVLRNGEKVQPLRRTGRGEDIARACLYLAGEESRFVTGTHVVVDGGLTVGPRHSWDSSLPAPAEVMGFSPEAVAGLLAENLA